MKFKMLFLMAFVTVVQFYGCGSTKPLPEKEKVTRDTLWLEKLVYDKIVVESNPSVQVVGDSSILIKPYVAVIDSLIQLHNRTLKLSARYSVPNNKFDLRIDEIRVDSLPVITVEKEKTFAKVEESGSDWYVYIGIGFLLAVVAGLGILLAVRR